MRYAALLLLLAAPVLADDATRLTACEARIAAIEARTAEVERRLSSIEPLAQQGAAAFGWINQQLAAQMTPTPTEAP